MKARGFLGPLISVVTILTSLLLIEALAWCGVVDYRLVLSTATDLPWTQPINRPDPTLVHLRRANLRLSGVQRGGDIAYYMQVPDPEDHPYEYIGDARGFRNRETVHTTDIALIGDSFAESLLVSQDRVAATVLAGLTGRRVTNFGQLWYSPLQELEVFRRFVKGTAPKTVIWLFFGGNDLEDYERDLLRAPKWAEEWQRIDSVWSRSFIRNVKQTIYNSLHPHPKSATQMAHCEGAGYTAPVYFKYLPHAADGSYQATLTKVVDVLRTAHRESQAIGAQMIVAYAPTKYDVLREVCERPQGFDFNRIERLPSVLRSQLGEEIPFVDLTPDLIAAAKSGIPPYFRDDTHWNDNGNSIAARTLSSALATIGTTGFGLDSSQGIASLPLAMTSVR